MKVLELLVEDLGNLNKLNFGNILKSSLGPGDKAKYQYHKGQSGATYGDIQSFYKYGFGPNSKIENMGHIDEEAFKSYHRDDVAGFVLYADGHAFLVARKSHHEGLFEVRFDVEWMHERIDPKEIPELKYRLNGGFKYSSTFSTEMLIALIDEVRETTSHPMNRIKNQLGDTSEDGDDDEDTKALKKKVNARIASKVKTRVITGKVVYIDDASLVKHKQRHDAKFDLNGREKFSGINALQDRLTRFKIEKHSKDLSDVKEFLEHAFTGSDKLLRHKGSIYQIAANEVTVSTKALMQGSSIPIEFKKKTGDGPYNITVNIRFSAEQGRFTGVSIKEGEDSSTIIDVAAEAARILDSSSTKKADVIKAMQQSIESASTSRGKFKDGPPADVLKALRVLKDSGWSELEKIEAAIAKAKVKKRVAKE